jgi:hypothetical protein
LKSGSKRSGDLPPELAAWQRRGLGLVAASTIGREVVFGGGAALAALHLHHRTSEDLDFFTTRQIEPMELASLIASLRTKAMTIDVEVVGPRTSLILVGRTSHVGRIDFAFYPFDPVGRRAKWREGPLRDLDELPRPGERQVRPWSTQAGPGGAAPARA